MGNIRNVSDNLCKDGLACYKTDYKGKEGNLILS